MGNTTHLCNALKKVLQAKSMWSDDAKAAEEMIFSMLQRELLCPGALHLELLQERIRTCSDRSAAVRLFADKSNTESDRLLGMLSMWKPRDHTPHVMIASALARL